MRRDFSASSGPGSDRMEVTAARRSSSADGGGEARRRERVKVREREKKKLGLGELNLGRWSSINQSMNEGKVCECLLLLTLG